MIQNHVTKSNSSTFHETCTWLALSWVLAWFDTGRSYQFHYVSMLLRLHICDWKWECHQRKREKWPAHHINTQPNTNCAHNLLYGIFCHLCNIWQYDMPWFLCTLPHTFSLSREHIYVSFRYNRFHHQIAFDNVIFTTVVILSGHNVLKRTDDISINCELNAEY